MDVASRAGYEFSPLVRPFGEAALLTQFAPGYDYENDPPVRLSAFADPLYLTQSVGVESIWTDWWTTRLSLGLKETLTIDHPAWTDDPGTIEVERERIEGGLFLASDWEAAWDGFFTFTSKLGLFASFDDITVIDVGWDNTLTVSVTGWLDLKATLRLSYDRDVLDDVQLAQTGALSVVFKLP